MTQRLTPWCLPSESGPDGGMALSTVCIPTAAPPGRLQPAPCPLATLLPGLWICLGPAQPRACCLLALVPCTEPCVDPAATSLAAARLNGTTKGERRREPGGYDSSSTLMSSELETTSFFDSDEDDSTSRWGLTFIGTGMGMRGEVTHEEV